MSLCSAASPHQGALHYRSTLLQIVDTALSLIPLLFGSREEKQLVPVVLHEDYIDSFVRWVEAGCLTFGCNILTFQFFLCSLTVGQMKPVVSVRVTLLKCKLEVYSAALRIEAELRSLTYVVCGCVLV